MKLFRSWRFWLGSAFLASLPPLLACGPFFPENALDQPKRILQPPLFHFAGELMKLPVPVSSSGRQPGAPAYTLDLEMAEMREVMKDRFPDAPTFEAWLHRYRDLRGAMIALGDDSDQPMALEAKPSTPTWPRVSAGLREVCGPLPKDIRLYLEGAAAYVEHQTGADETHLQQARAAWKELLAVPVGERHWRSTWAAWMLFRTTSAEQKAEQGQWLSAARHSAEAEKCADCLHLGIEATYILARPGSDLPGREAITDADWKRAAFLRVSLGHSRSLQQLKGDRWVRSKWSEELAAAILADPYLRRVQLLHLIEVAEAHTHWSAGERGEPEAPNPDLELWLTSFEKAEAHDQKEAGMLAWISYNAARFQEAARWLRLAPKDDVIALSLRGKLAAQAGKRQETVKLFAAMARQIPPSTNTARVDYLSEERNSWDALTVDNFEAIRRHHLLADRGTAQLAVNDFTGALQTFLQTDFWADSAFIAERLMSSEELLSLARAGRLPGVTVPPLSGKLVGPPQPEDLSVESLAWRYGGRWGFGMSTENHVDPLLFLLSRCLMRDRFFKDAARVAPEDLRRVIDRYAAEYRRGHDTRLTRVERSASLWTAAQIHRKLGMELFGFENGPDFAFSGGGFDYGGLVELRSKVSWISEWGGVAASPEMRLRQVPVFPATADELWRSRRYGPVIEKRFHYRYVAADLAWQAAALLPDNDPESARILCTAGNWLKNRDPKAADRFYKALVRRNPEVPLAQEADKKRWLPYLESDSDVTLR